MQAAIADRSLISLAAGFVDEGTLPVELVREIVAELTADPAEARRALQYGTTGGDLGLRRRLIANLEREDGAEPGAYAEAIDRTVLTTGSQQLLALVTDALLDPGDIVLVEAPTYFVYMGMLQSRGVRAIGVATDDDGLCLDSLEQALSGLEASGELGRVKLIYTVAEHSNPTGLSLAADRRAPLVEAARRWSKLGRIFVVEDAAYRGLTFDGHDDPPSIFSHDKAGDTVILARTFSKTFSPGMKCGWGILPKSILRPILSLKGNQDFGSANFNQVVLERVLADPRFGVHVRKLIDAYGRKRDALLESLAEYMGPLDPEIRWTEPKGGIYVWLTLPAGVDTSATGPYIARCRAQGVLYVPGDLSYPDEPTAAPRNRIRLCYGVVTEPQIREGVRRMAAALAECLDPVA